MRFHLDLVISVHEEDGFLYNMYRWWAGISEVAEAGRSILGSGAVAYRAQGLPIMGGHCCQRVRDKDAGFGHGEALFETSPLQGPSDPARVGGPAFHPPRLNFFRVAARSCFSLNTVTDSDASELRAVFWGLRARPPRRSSPVINLPEFHSAMPELLGITHTRLNSS